MSTNTSASDDATAAPAHEVADPSTPAIGPASGNLIFRRPSVAPSAAANPRDSARREWLLDHVARRQARRDATVALMRSSHLADAAAADPQLQSELSRLMAFLRDAPGSAGHDPEGGADDR
ncbi:MAG: hypothetical protein GTN84_18100 [Hydrogenophaga sp.]|uniref:hypothetical protein n=1 Tax=Hydrogenophaga sp. TaxID=1904254 RepID=UPI001695283B|nr:hypothetical protein [Hydrogenophaga sp.]NIM43156.1 hypothetical protein [Hydrogenophaga sp.]NIN28224.1 hypothetical protein [Hydrogenophaga sp.]NIN30662.1 hypothetical protein [Hydrogenophaga sp.]NIN57359.1 hypothetical protein [Hydrogenophaga sp.]NIO51578.1 hypothetical protein [Hydrogenophaga sp.]